MPNFVQIDEIAWEEFEKVVFFDILRICRKKNGGENGAYTTRLSTIH